VKFTFNDLSNKNYDLNQMFSKISPKRYYGGEMGLLRMFKEQKDQKNVSSIKDIQEEVGSSKTIPSIGGSRRSLDESSSVYSLHMPTIRKKQNTEQILSKWDKNKVDPIKFGLNVYDLLSSDLEQMKMLDSHYMVRISDISNLELEKERELL
jgi:hypothetical protein